MTGRELPEWIGASAVSPVPPRVKLRIVDRQAQRCDGCKRPFSERLRPQFDHRPALCNSGQNRESMIVAVCHECHSTRTADDVEEKSETYQTRLKHLGLNTKRKWRF